MTRLILSLFAVGALALAGCDKGKTSAPSTDPNKPGETRELTVLAPGDQTLEKNKTNTFTVTIKRSNFTDPVDIKVENLPAGVKVVSPDKLQIPGDKSTLDVTLKADGDAKPVNDHKVTIKASAKDMKEAVAQFEVDVK